VTVYAIVTGIGAPIGLAIGGGIEQDLAPSSGAGQAAGTSTAAAVGTSDALTAGTAAGTSTAVGVVVGDILAVGLSAGTSTVLAVGSSDRSSVGTSAGVATVIGTGTRTTQRTVRARVSIRSGSARASIGTAPPP